MKTSKNLSDSELKQIAASIGGKLWIKDTKKRIYVSGGNNYHYDGKWYIDFETEGQYEAKVYLEKGWNNANAAEYKAKYLKEMENDVEEAIAAMEPDGAVTKETPELPKMTAEILKDQYHGCGSYAVDFKDGQYHLENINSSMLETNGRSHLLYLDGSGTMFYFRNEADARKVLADVNIYYVPKAGGGKHKNIELK